MMRWHSIPNRIARHAWWPWVAIGALGLLCVAPLWLTPYLPTQDGPSHIYNVHVLRQMLQQADAPTLARFFTLHLSLTPNLTGTALLLLFATVLPLLAAEKLLVSLIVLLLPLSLLYVIRAFDKRGGLFALVGVLYAYHNLLLLGFYNFSLGLTVALLTIGFWLRRRHRLTITNGALFVVLCMLTYLSHFAAFAFLLLALGCIGVQDGLLWISADQSATPDGRMTRAAFRRYIAALLPAFVMAFTYMLPQADSEAIFIGRDMLLKILLRYGTLVTYSIRHEVVLHLFQMLVIAAIILTLMHRIRAHAWRSERDSMLWLSLLLFAGFALLPWWKGNGGWINNRLLLMGTLSLACWLIPTSRRAALVLGGGLLLGIAMQTIWLTQEWHALQPELKAYADAASYIHPHATIGYDLDSATRSHALQTDTVNIAPFKHAACYAALGRDIVYMDNYEAKFDYFPIQWKPGRPTPQPDYILARHATREPPPTSIGLYRRIYTTRTLSLLQHTQTAEQTTTSAKHAQAEENSHEQESDQ